MKLHLAKGYAYTIENGERKNVTVIEVPSPTDCCKLDCCNNKLVLPTVDANGDSTFKPSDLQIVNVGGTIKIRVTVDLGAGPVVKEISLS